VIESSNIFADLRLRNFHSHKPYRLTLTIKSVFLLIMIYGSVWIGLFELIY